MIKKWRNRVLIYGLITAFVVIIGYYFFINIQQTNIAMEGYKSGEVMLADMSPIDGGVYTDSGKHRYKYSLTVDNTLVEGVTMTAYTKEEVSDMNYKVEIYVLFGEEITSYEKAYIDNFVPWVPSQSILLWIIAGITFSIAMYYVIRNIILIVVLKKGEESIGRFEEAYHSKMGSNKYYKVKYTYIRDGEEATAVSPAYYDGRQVDKLKSYGSFNVRYKGKICVIDQKL